MTVLYYRVSQPGELFRKSGNPEVKETPASDNTTESDRADKGHLYQITHIYDFNNDGPGSLPPPHIELWIPNSVPQYDRPFTVIRSVTVCLFLHC